VQEIQNEKIRKRRELAVFYELSELRKAKDKDTYRKVGFAILCTSIVTTYVKKCCDAT